MIRIQRAAAPAAVCLLLVSCVSVRVAPKPEQPAEISIIPKPRNVERLSGAFLFSAETRVIVPAGDEASRAVADDFAARMDAAAGFELRVVEVDPARPSDIAANAVVFRKIEDSELGAEGYRLAAGPTGIALEANSPAGFFYGEQTLLQLLPAPIFSGRSAPGRAWAVPAVVISDVPRFPWRGLLLDVSRHFFPKEFVKKVIDVLAMHKMNVFHWHLTDDQGWRVEIKKYPRLTEVGAWRVNREDEPWTRREPPKEGETPTYGGFYTQDDIREVVAYAKSRSITIVPEIEMPGHCLAALAAYPQLSCSGGPFFVPSGSPGPVTDVYCAGNDEAFSFLEDVLTEVMALFPGEYIHIGGDEVDKSNWKKCPKCQARMKTEGLKTEEELQSYFIKRIEKFVNAKGRKLIGWDEILEGGLAPNAAVMSWRGTEGGIAAARAGHDVVMTPTSHCYFDYYQGPPAYEPPAIGGFLPVAKVYGFEPMPSELNAEEAAHIRGVQANLWTEYIPSSAHAEYMILPRLAAIAEVGWSASNSRDWKDFAARLAAQFERYDAAGIRFSTTAYNVRIAPKLDSRTRELAVALENEIGSGEIRFTLDGRDPTPTSALYDRPFRLKKSSIVKASTFAAGQPVGQVTRTDFIAHLALGKTPKLAFSYQQRYSGGGDMGLVDGLRGSKAHGDGLWQGFEQDDLVAELDLGKPHNIKKITTGFLRSINSWIFFPRSVEYAVSADGKDYRLVATIMNDASDQDPDILIKDFSAALVGVRARFVRVRAKNIGLCPEGHPGAGDKAWLFVDEIIVE